MREYDGTEKHIKTSDSDNEKNLKTVENILGFRPTTEQLEFDLFFYAGGSGVIDKLAISCQASPDQKTVIRKKLNLHSPTEAFNTEPWKDDFIGLIEVEDEDINLLTWSSNFVNDNKSPFQDICSTDDEILFSYESDVNSWTVVWGKGSRLNYRYFDQG